MKKLLFTFWGFMALTVTAKAQSPDAASTADTIAMTAGTADADDSTELITFDMAPRWIADHVRFPAGAFGSHISFTAPVYIGITWSGKVYLTQRPWYPDPAFEDEIVRVVASMPPCVPVDSRVLADTRKTFTINFSKLLLFSKPLPYDSLRNFTLSKSFIAPRFDARSPFMSGDRYAFLKWVYNKFRVPKQFAGAALVDTVTIDYTVDAAGATTGVAVRCKENALRAALLDAIGKAHAWDAPARINSMEHSVRMRDRIVVGINADGTKAPMRQYFGPAYENNEKLPPEDSNMILTSVTRPAQVKQSEYLTRLNELSANLRSEIQSYKPADSSKLYTVVASFVVEKDGSISNMTVERAIDQKMEREITKTITSEMKWNPAQQGGEAVRSWALLTWNCPTAYLIAKYQPAGSTRNRPDSFRPDNYSAFGGGYTIYRRGVEASDINLSAAGNSNYYYSNEYGQWSAIFNPFTGKYDTYHKIGTGTFVP